MMSEVELSIFADSQQTKTPWLSSLCRNFQVQLVIKKASADADMGAYVVSLSGSVEEIQRATAWLMTTGMQVEAKERALGA